MMSTRIALDRADGNLRISLEAGLVVPRLVSSDATSARVALVAGGALLLGGDSIDIEIDVGPGCHLTLEDIGGTVAYDGEGRPAFWSASAIVRTGANLNWHGLPFVVTDCALVERTIAIDLDPDATALLRDTVVLGRAGEKGGRVALRTRVTLDNQLLLVEEFQLAGDRGVPGITGGQRILDTILRLGYRAAAHIPPGVVSLDLDGPGSIYRWLGNESHLSPLGTIMETTSQPRPAVQPLGELARF